MSVSLFTELRELVDLHGQGHSEANDEEVDEVLTYDEVLIIKVSLSKCLYFVYTICGLDLLYTLSGNLQVTRIKGESTLMCITYV